MKCINDDFVCFFLFTFIDFVFWMTTKNHFEFSVKVFCRVSDLKASSNLLTWLYLFILEWTRCFKLFFSSFKYLKKKKASEVPTNIFTRKSSNSFPGTVFARKIRFSVLKFNFSFRSRRRSSNDPDIDVFPSCVHVLEKHDPYPVLYTVITWYRKNSIIFQTVIIFYHFILTISYNFFVSVFVCFSSGIWSTRYTSSGTPFRWPLCSRRCWFSSRSSTKTFLTFFTHTHTQTYKHHHHN